MRRVGRQAGSCSSGPAVGQGRDRSMRVGTTADRAPSRDLRRSGPAPHRPGLAALMAPTVGRARDPRCGRSAASAMPSAPPRRPRWPRRYGPGRCRAAGSRRPPLRSRRRGRAAVPRAPSVRRQACVMPGPDPGPARWPAYALMPHEHRPARTSPAVQAGPVPTGPSDLRSAYALTARRPARATARPSPSWMPSTTRTPSRIWRVSRPLRPAARASRCAGAGCVTRS